MIRKIEYDRETKEGYILHVTDLYLFRYILIYTKSVLKDTLVID